MKVQRTFAATAAGLTFLLAGIALGTAGASPIKWVPVQLGTHQFGRLRAPDAVVAHAGPAEVAFNKRSACGCLDGPQGPMLFDVAPNGSIWLFDVLNHRLLVWQHGRPARPARALALPKLDVRDFALVDRSRKVVRAWRVLSKTPLALAQRTLTPALVGGDLVVELDVSRQVRSTLRSEHVVMRLSPTGMRKRFSLDAKTVWGDNGDQPVAALRIGSDGRLYQLRTNPKTGASIARYSLGAA